MEMDKPGVAGPSKHLGRIASPPRTLPSLDETGTVLFDSRQVPFSPTSPGKRSPGRPRTMKEYEEDLANLTKDNFNLKIRIYFMEQNRMDSNLPKDVNELRTLYTDLKVNYELQKKDLSSKEDLLLDSYRALESQKQQLESMKAGHEAEKQELQNKIDTLEKELEEYHMKFMETSVQLDDTNAMYAMTFGLNNKLQPNILDSQSGEKVKELENDLVKEKERGLMMEDKIVSLSEKIASDQKHLLHLQGQLQAMEGKLMQALKERDLVKESIKEAAYQRQKLDKSLYKTYQAVTQKESEVESMKAMMKDLEKELAIANSKLQKKDEASVQTDATTAELHKQLKSLFSENKKLKQELTVLQQQLENRSGSRALRERSSGRRSLEREQVRQLKDSQAKIEELQKEVEDLKTHRPRNHHSGVEGIVQSMFKENRRLKKEVDDLKHRIGRLSGTQTDSLKEETGLVIDASNREMTSEKDNLISELQSKIEELNKIINEKQSKLQEYKLKLDSFTNNVGSEQAKSEHDQKAFEDSIKQDREKEFVLKELEEKKREVESLKKELKKKTFNLQGLVNTELWDKNREIEKLNKVCERQHLEVLSLQKQVREYQLTSIGLQASLFPEDKENLQPVSDSLVQLQFWAEEKRSLMRKIEDLETQVNTPERDTESLLVKSLRAEKDQAETLRREAVNACVLLTTRLQELADFLDSLLPSLCGKKRRVVQQAVERSRELSRSLSLAAEESSLHCSAWTDLQPSLYVPLLPDISTVDFWSGDEEEAFSGVGEVARLKSQVETLTEEVKQKDGEIAKFQSEKNLSDNFFLKSVFGFDEQHLIDNMESNRVLDENAFCGNIADITEGSLVETCSDLNNLDKNPSTKPSPEVKSANIGTITLTSRKKDPNTLLSVEGESKSKDKDGCLSEYETWSEPDRDVSFARMGLKEESASISKAVQFNCDDTSETADSAPKSPSSRRASEIQRLQRKIHSLEQVNEALRSELVILHQLTPPALTRQDKATSIELSRQSLFCVPSHLLEEIRNQREKLEASLFHNDYIRRQLESTVSSLRRSQGDDQEKASLVRLKEVTNQLELAENELSDLKLEKENLNRKIASLQVTVQDNTRELAEKQSALSELESKTTQRLKEVEEKYNQRCLQSEQKCHEMEQKWSELQKEKEQLLEKIAESDQQIAKLSAEIANYEQEGKKNKTLQEELNVQLQQIGRQKDSLQNVVADQEQLLADAERERQELATQLIARDRQVSELQGRLSHAERSSGELETNLRAQLDTCNKRREEAVVELQRRLDAARFAHSEAVLQYTRVANDNIKLQQELRRRQHEPNQVAQVERMKSELERRVAELEALNADLETRLASLNIVKPPYSDCETDGCSSVVGSPRRPPPLILPSSPHHPYATQRSHDLTSDYLSDPDAALSSPQAQHRSLWFPTSPHSQTSASPDLGIESDHGRFSSLETHLPKPTALSLRATPDLMKLEEENTQLRRNLQKTRHALEETLSQLTAANQHKRQYEAQLSAANQHKAKVERAICRQLHKTHTILKKARVNLEEDGKGETH